MGLTKEFTHFSALSTSCLPNEVSQLLKIPLLKSKFLWYFPTIQEKKYYISFVLLSVCPLMHGSQNESIKKLYIENQSHPSHIHTFKVTVHTSSSEKHQEPERQKTVLTQNTPMRAVNIQCKEVHTNLVHDCSVLSPTLKQYVQILFKTPHSNNTSHMQLEIQLLLANEETV